jgi:hypothetical protein
MKRQSLPLFITVIFVFWPAVCGLCRLCQRAHRDFCTFELPSEVAVKEKHNKANRQEDKNTSRAATAAETDLPGATRVTGVGGRRGPYMKSLNCSGSHFPCLMIRLSGGLFMMGWRESASAQGPSLSSPSPPWGPAEDVSGGEIRRAD